VSEAKRLRELEAENARLKMLRADDRLSNRRKAHGEQYPHYGYLMLHGMLNAEGLVMNRIRTYRFYKSLGMQVRTNCRKKLVRPRIPMTIPTRVVERWSLDFVHDFAHGCGHFLPAAAFAQGQQHAMHFASTVNATTVPVDASNDGQQLPLPSGPAALAAMTPVVISTARDS